MIATRLTELLEVEVPLINAPMTPQAGGRLARAVSEAGALGMIGVEEIDTEEGIAAEVAIVQAGTPVPFGIGLVAWVIDQRPELLDIAIAARPKLISISFGDAGPHVARLHDAGILVASQVQSRHWAEVAVAAGVDIVVAQGTEAGGHTGAVGTLPLLQIVLELTDLPVVAAGGIATGRGLAAVLAAGAVGGWVGTPFLLAEEARNSPAARERIAHSDETETLYTSVYDRLQDKAWPAEFGARAIRNRVRRPLDGARGRARFRDGASRGVRPGARSAGLRRRAHLRGSVDRDARRRAAGRGDRRGDRGSGARAARPLVVAQRRSAALTAAAYPR